MGNSKKAQKIDKEILSVKYEDFRDYMKDITKVLEIYQKNKAIKNVRQREKELINISESLVKCYRVVKPYFFDERFIFDFSYFVRDIQQLRNTQEEVFFAVILFVTNDIRKFKLTEYLDHVELNLFYQITNKFHEFMDVIINLNEMEKEVENCLSTIEFYKFAADLLLGKLKSFYF